MAASNLTTIMPRIVAALAFAGALMAATDSSVAAPPSKPHMKVVFEIRSPTFRRALPELAKAEANLAQGLADEFARRHRFADWTGADLPGAPMGELIARLEEVTARPFNQVLVKWFVKTPSGTIEELPLQAVEIYAPTNNNWDAGSRERFETRVLGKISGVIQVQGFQDSTFKDVLSKLPIATSVLPVESERVILVPLMWKDMRLGEESELLVKFTNVLAQGPRQGSITLSRINERSRGSQGVGFVQGGIRKGMLDALDMPLTQQWNPSLSALLGNSTVRCYITNFKLAEFEDGIDRDLPQ